MFFIFGSPRSGTTLLAQSLHAHSQVMVADETDFIVPAAMILSRVPNESLGRHLIREILMNSKRSSSVCDLLSFDDIQNVIETAPYDCRIVTQLFDRIAVRHNRMMCGDKSPNDLLSLPYLFNGGFIDGSDTPVVHIVRNIRDVMHSVERLEWVKESDHYFIRQWSAANMHLYSRMKNSPNYHLIRYEDFVSRPVEVLEGLCTKLGVAFEPGMLEPERKNTTYKSFDHHQKLFEPISPQWIGEAMSASCCESDARFKVQAGEALETFGYNH